MWVAVVGRGCGTRTVERTLAVQGGGGNRATPCEHTSLALDPATSMDPAGPPLPDSRASRLRLPLVKVLVIGNGAREHAIVRALTLDPSVDAVIAAPGNPGIDAIALCRELPQGLLDGEGVAALAVELGVNLVVVGPEAPLVAGVADAVRERVRSGQYASESEVVRDGLRALIARDRAVEAWLQGEVAAAYDAMQANPEDVIEAADVRAHLAARRKA